MTAAAVASGQEQATSEDQWLRAPWSEVATPAWLLGDGLRLVVLSAHPDDETLGAGGLIAAAARAGRPVEVVVATAGEASHPGSRTTSPARLAQRRRAEAARAAETLGAGFSGCLGLPDGDLAGHEQELRRALEDLVGGGDDTLLLAPWSSDRHPDHEAAGRAAADVARRTGATLLHYPVWLWQWGSTADVPWERAVRLDLDRDARRRKDAALRCYPSQVEGLSNSPGDEPVVPGSLLAAAGRDFEVFWLDDPNDRVADEMDTVHRGSPDPWGVTTRWYERRKRAVTLASLPGERYQRALEVGCSVGGLTADLAERADRVVGVDVSEASLEHARSRLAGLVAQGRVCFERLQVPWQWPEGYFDLIMVSEVGYFLSADAWAGLVDRCLDSLAPDGALVACHWRGEPVGWPMDGDRLHATLTSDDRLQVLVSHDERDFWLHVLSPAG